MTNELLKTFSNPEAVARYTEGPKRFVPGFEALQAMTTILLAERAPDAGRILVLGAGGGLELKAFAEAEPGWTFDGVDPSAEMLSLAEATLGPLIQRVRLHEGLIFEAPAGPFDAATCLLTLHFLDTEERLRTLREIRQRLNPGAPFVAAHVSIPQGEAERTLWYARHAAFVLASGVEPDEVEKAQTAMKAHLEVLAPDEDEALLRDAGFSSVSLFYTGFTWRGWVANA